MSLLSSVSQTLKHRITKFFVSIPKSHGLDNDVDDSVLDRTKEGEKTV